jgi:hypothetical protein
VLSSRDASGSLPQPHARPPPYIVAVLRFLALQPGGLSTLQWGYWADHPLRGDLTAIAVAQQQNARSFALRAALSLAKLYRATGRDADARAALRPALEGFSPTPEFPEVGDAQRGPYRRSGKQS